MPVNMAVRLQDNVMELTSPVLPQDVIDNIRIFFVFLGYPWSGHTILGALMDAHPNMVISHQYNPCINSRLSNKNHLFDEMYRNSYMNAMDINGARGQNHNKKNYTQHTLLIHGKESTISTYMSLETKVLVNYLPIRLIQSTESYILP